MKVGDLIRFKPDLKWLHHHDNVGILLMLEKSWVGVFWPGVDNGLYGVYLAKELEVLSESR